MCNASKVKSVAKFEQDQNHFSSWFDIYLLSRLKYIFNDY